jgi:hypothetical protein
MVRREHGRRQEPGQDGVGEGAVESYAITKVGPAVEFCQGAFETRFSSIESGGSAEHVEGALNTNS